MVVALVVWSIANYYEGLKMKPKLIFIAVLMCMALIGAVQAQNMSISRLGTGTLETVQIYNGTTLEGTYNTSTNGIALPDGDFLLIIKPVASNPLADPGTWMSDAFAYVQTNITALLQFASCIGSGLCWSEVKMKHLLAVCISLCLIAAITPGSVGSNNDVHVCTRQCIELSRLYHQHHRVQH